MPDGLQNVSERHLCSTAILAARRISCPLPRLPYPHSKKKKRAHLSGPIDSCPSLPPCTTAFPSRSKKQQQAHLSGPIDVIVATPTRFLQHVKEGNVFYKDISWLVVDEADTILADKGWAEELKTILGPLRARPDRPKAAVVLVSATMSKVGG